MLPTINKNGWFWFTEYEFTEESAMPIIGLLNDSLQSNELEKYTIDLSDTKWADPLPLLMLGIVLANSRSEKIIIDLGASDSSRDHKIFLKFFARQKFLYNLSKSSRILFDNKIQTSIEALDGNFSAIPYESVYPNSDCIFAKIEPVVRFRNAFSDSKKIETEEKNTKIQSFVEDIIAEARARAIDSAFRSDPRAKDLLFQKLRKVFFELILNSVEHAYDHDTNNGHVAVYARIRSGKPDEKEKAREWESSYAMRTRKQLAIAQFLPNKFADWVEIFVCDAGCGLTKHIQEWSKSVTDSRLKTAINKAALSPYPIRSIGPYLFKSPLSRMPRQNQERTSVTGLMHLGHTLAFGGDYARIYTEEGVWIGGKFPWQPEKTGSQAVPSSQREKADTLHPPGTAYAICIQPDSINVHYPAGEWLTCDSETRGNIVKSLLKTQRDRPSPPGNMVYFEKRSVTDGRPPSIENLTDKIGEQTETVILRPPRLLSKQDIGQWISIFAGDINRAPTFKIKNFIIAEMTPFQAITFSEFFKTLAVNAASELNIFILSEDWRVTCITKNPGKARSFDVNLELARKFMGSYDSTSQISAALLATVLREKDSELFWGNESTTPLENLFRNEDIEWINSSGDKFPLRGFLDLGQVLVDPVRYRICRRALRRCLALIPDMTAIPIDDLVESILSDAISGTYRTQPLKGSGSLAVGSIGVTNGTMERFVKREDLDVKAKIYLLIHGEMISKIPEDCLAALLWIPPNIVSADANGLPWSRIPNTPYVAPFGQRSISLVRFPIDQKETPVDFEKQHYYPTSPQQMYRELSRYSSLRAGHWNYRGRHDFITLNLASAFHSSMLELSSLYQWLRNQFEELFGDNGIQPPFASVLIYPSHHVTDMIIGHLIEDSEFTNHLPSDGIFAIRFVGKNSVSPILANPVIVNRIKEKTRGKSWRGVVFDDGVISGKHIRELSHILTDLGAQAVFTLALVDRTGLPARDGVMKSWLKRHRRYWRFDVPSLGHKRDCALCRTLQIAETLRVKIAGRTKLERLDEWIKAWAARDVDTQWRTSGVFATSFLKPVPLKFGIYASHSDSEVEYKSNEILFHDSTSLTSALIELTRMTTRSDKALSKSIELKDQYPLAAIEIISAQLLIFIDELNYWELKDRFNLLLTILWSQSTASDLTALAGLCFTLVDSELTNEVWTHCKTLLKSSSPKNIDAILATNILIHKKFRDADTEYEIGDESSDTERENYLLLGYETGLKSTLSALINIIGDRSAQWHGNHLRDSLDKLASSHGISDENPLQSHIEYLNSKLPSVVSLLRNRCFETHFSCSTASTSPAFLADQITIHLSTLRSGNFLAQRDSAIEISKNLYQAGGVTEYLNKYAFIEIPPPSGVERLVGTLIGECSRNWSTLVQAREKSIVYESWNQEGIIVEPIWRCAAIDPCTSRKTFAYIDDLIRTAIKDLLLNVYHAGANELISCPWPSTPSTVLAHMWWKPEIDDSYLRITFSNHTSARTFDLSYTLAIAGLERVDGRITTRIESEIAYSTIEVPLFEHFLKDH